MADTTGIPLAPLLNKIQVATVTSPSLLGKCFNQKTDKRQVPLIPHLNRIYVLNQQRLIFC